MASQALGAGDVVRNAAAACDVLVVGSGLAGLVAACTAQRLGARVLVAEKSAEAPGWNNSRVASGIFHVNNQSMETPVADLAERVRVATGGSARPELLTALLTELPAALRWLQEYGVRYVHHGAKRLLACEPVGTGRLGLACAGLGMEQCLIALHQGAVAAGARYWTAATAVELTRDDRRAVTGAVVTQAGARCVVTAKAVILADGGFQANPEMVREYVSPAPERLVLRATDTGTGDGIRMAIAAGARCVNMPYFYGHCLHRSSTTNPRLWPYPWLDGLVAAGIVVDATGRRVLDEGCGGIAAANALARRTDPQDCWVVFDHAMWTGPGAADVVLPPNPSLPALGGVVLQADTPAALGHLLGIDTSALTETLAVYNQAVQAGKASELPRPRTSAGRLLPLRDPPYYAVPLVPGITHTMGGLLISPRGEVLDAREQPIPGLYAAGATAGGLDGGPHAGYVGGLSQALVFGRLAGAAAARAAMAARG